MGDWKKEHLAEEVLAELKRRLEAPKAAILGQLLPEEEKEIRSMYQIAAEPFDLVIAARLSVEGMVQAALGNPGNAEASCLLSALLKGKKVYILEKGLEYRSYRDTAFKPLYGLYQAYERTLMTYGAELISDISEIRRKEPRQAAFPEKNCMDLTGIRVLKEADLNRVRGNGIGAVLIGKKTLITPLALDYLTNHNLEIRRQE